MQEDKLGKKLAESLKKYQEEVFQPYEQGAWETFAQARGTKQYFWRKYAISGLAAVLLVGLGWWWMKADSGVDLILPEDSGMLAMDSVQTSPSDALLGFEHSAEQITIDSTEGISKTTPASQTVREDSQDKLVAAENPSINTSSVALPAGKTTDIEGLIRTQKEELPDFISKSNEWRQMPPISLQRISPFWDIKEYNFLTQSFLPTQDEEKKRVEELLKQMDDREELTQKVIAKPKTKISLEIGVSPSFGSQGTIAAATQGNQSGSEITSHTMGFGLTMMYALSPKLEVGSGIGYSTMNQETLSLLIPTNALARNTSPGEDKMMINQAQLEVPFFVQYPLTSNQSISVRAGFSSVYAFNQEAGRESTFTRHVVAPVSGGYTYGNTQYYDETVVQYTSMDPMSQRFFPFASINMGLNFRLHQSNKTEYLLMPFYTLPMSEFTGYSKSPGMIGASFRIRFYPKN